jgi:ribosome-binding protein aMBF1 (putative translation factor)
MPRVRTLTPGASPTHHFGSEVRRARDAAGMSQSELGALVPCDKSAVSRVEAGLTSPDEAFARACDAAFPQMGGWFMRCGHSSTR